MLSVFFTTSGGNMSSGNCWDWNQSVMLSDSKGKQTEEVWTGGM